MSGIPPVADPLWVNVTTSSTWGVPVEWWPFFTFIAGFICGIMIATLFLPWGRSP